MLAPHQQRVVDEHKDLVDKISKLGRFIDGEIFHSVPSLERDRLRRQYKVMQEYAGILADRIAHF